MVRRSRKMSTQSNYFNADNEHLEAKNTELAKALSEYKNLYNQVLNERDHYQQELFRASLRITKLENIMNSINIAARESIASVVALSNHTSDIVRLVSLSKCIFQKDESDRMNSSSFKKENVSGENKMQVVKPMISGHVILRPTINLRRVNEISQEEMESLQGQGSSGRFSGGVNDDQNNSPNDSFQRRSTRRAGRRRSNTQYVDESEGNFIDNNDNNDEVDGSMHSSEANLDINRLDAIEEERDSELMGHTPVSPRRSSFSSSGTSLALPSTSTQIPLLSGVFKDVRVYLSPVDPHSNITKVRGSNKSYYKRSSDIQPQRLSGNLSVTQEENGNPIRVSNARRTNICSSTPLQSTNVYDDNSNLRNHFEMDRSDNSVNLNQISKRWSENTRPRNDYLRNKNIFLKHARSTISNSTMNNDYDPLEGPSNLLDSPESNKVETLQVLGLTPVAQLSETPKSTSPASTVLKRRKQLKQQNNDNSTSTQHTQSFVTKRKAEPIKKEPKTPKMERLSTPNSPARIKRRPSSSPITSIPKHKKRTRKRFQEVLNSPSIKSPHRKKSPIKSERAKRAITKVSLKEPSLRKKLRRSK